jgi:PAS domain S-box-containing protein
MNPFRENIRVLLVDDDKGLLDLEAEFLEKHLKSPEIIKANSAVEATEIMEDDEIEAIVSDYQMPRMTGQEFLEKVREDYPKMPFILFTGMGSEEVAGEAISSGVTDYLQKSAGTSVYEVLSNKVENAVEEYREGKMSSIFKTAVDESDENVIVTDVSGDILYVNEAFSDFTGYDSDEALGENPKLLKSNEHGEEFYKDLWDTILDGEIWSEEMVDEKKNGDQYEVNQKIIPTMYGSETYFIAMNIPEA